MSAAFFFLRFLRRPFQIASVIPSSPMMVRRVAGKMDFSRPLVVAEYGPGEGCHSREILRRLAPGSRLLLFELDPEFSQNLRQQFAHDPRVEVINGDAASLPEELSRRGLTHCDYVLSGIPFSILPADKKRSLLEKTFRAVRPGGAFVIYQVTNELLRHARVDGLFPRATSEYFLLNVPPMFIVVFSKDPAPAGAAPAPAFVATSRNGAHQPAEPALTHQPGQR